LSPFYSEYLAGKAGVIAKELAEFEGVGAVILFGSIGQGKGSNDSDIDLLIILKHRDEFLEGRISDTISKLSVQLGIPVEPVFMSIAGFKTVVKRGLRFIFGLMEGYRCLVDRANVGSILRKKEEEIKKKYWYDEGVGMWIPRR
jgi:predicted nucleotidyltransferase